MTFNILSSLYTSFLQRQDSLVTALQKEMANSIFYLYCTVLQQDQSQLCPKTCRCLCSIVHCTLHENNGRPDWGGMSVYEPPNSSFSALIFLALIKVLCNKQRTDASISECKKLLLMWELHTTRRNKQDYIESISNRGSHTDPTKKSTFLARIQRAPEQVLNLQRQLSSSILSVAQHRSKSGTFTVHKTPLL